jgi:hypothetical protein
MSESGTSCEFCGNIMPALFPCPGLGTGSTRTGIDVRHETGRKTSSNTDMHQVKSASRKETNPSANNNNNNRRSYNKKCTDSTEIRLMMAVGG